MFSLNRFWQYLKSDIIENKVMYVAALFASFAVMILIAALFVWLQTFASGALELKNLFNFISAFVLLLTVSLAFWDLTNKGRFLNTVRKPASMLEKYLARVLFFVILFPLLQRVFFIIVEYCRVLFVPIFEGDWFMSIYGMGMDESILEYFFNINLAWFPAMILSLMVVTLVLYQSATFGGIKAFLHFLGSFLFGMMMFVCLILLLGEVSDTVINSMPQTVVDIHSSGVRALEVSLILSILAMLMSSIVCIKSTVSRIVGGPYKVIWGYVALAAGLALVIYVYYNVVGLLAIREIFWAKLIAYTFGIVDFVWLAWGSYRNFAKRQLND